MESHDLFGFRTHDISLPIRDMQNKSMVKIPVRRQGDEETRRREREDRGRTEGGQIPANHGGFGQTSGGRQRLGASDWRRIGRRRGPQ